MVLCLFHFVSYILNIIWSTFLLTIRCDRRITNGDLANINTLSLFVFQNKNTISAIPVLILLKILVYFPNQKRVVYNKLDIHVLFVYYLF
jgi:hypothetical protein